MPNRFLRPEFFHRPRQAIRAIRQRLTGDPKDPVVCPLPWGSAILVDVHDYIGHRVFRHGVTALEACEAAFRLLKKGDIAIDAGANQGVVTSAMSINVGRSGCIFSIEMLPETFQKLEHNIKAWGAQGSCVRPINAAVSDRKGLIQVGLSPDFSNNSGVAYATHDGVVSGHETREVECITLDDLLSGMESIQLLKLDVERHEYAALCGAAQLLNEHRIRHLIFEDHVSGNSEPKQLLRKNGYTVFSVKSDLLKPSLRPCGNDLRAEPSDCYQDFIATCDEQALQSAYQRPGYLCLSRRARE